MNLDGYLILVELALIGHKCAFWSVLKRTEIL